MWDSIALLAETHVEDIFTGGAGWAGAGLLGLVLGWLLLKHLPEKDRQLLELVKGCDAQVLAVASKFDAALDKRDVVYQASIKQQREDAISALKVQRDDFIKALDMMNAQHEARVIEIAKAIHVDLNRADFGVKKPIGGVSST